MTPICRARGSFLVTDMSREQMEAAGYGFHHESEDGKYLIMGNGTQAFAVAVEQPQRENPLRTAELSTEQNENMIDGIINNTPPEPQPEEPEQLSFEDVAAGSGQTQEETPGASLHKRLSAIIPSMREPPAAPRKPSAFPTTGPAAPRLNTGTMSIRPWRSRSARKNV